MNRVEIQKMIDKTGYWDAIVVCKEIEVERLPIKENKFFWQHL